MKNVFILLALIILALLLFNIWGSMNARMIVIESKTGSYLPETTPVRIQSQEPVPSQTELLNTLTLLESLQKENARSIAAILEKLETLSIQTCTPAPCKRTLVQRAVIYFEHDRNDLTAGEQNKIDTLANELTGNALVLLKGYADSSGNNQHNYLLSLRRAATVKKQLDAKLKDREENDRPLIAIEAAGEELAIKNTEDGVKERLNRAVEILVYRQ